MSAGEASETFGLGMKVPNLQLVLVGESKEIGRSYCCHYGIK